MHAHYVLAWTGPYLSQIGIDQKDESIYGIRRSCWTSLNTYFTTSPQASMHAPNMLACRGPYLSQIESDQRDQSIYGIRRTCRTSLSTKFDPSMQACVHTHYFLACLGPYLSLHAWLLCACVHRPIYQPIREIKVSMESE